MPKKGSFTLSASVKDNMKDISKPEQQFLEFKGEISNLLDPSEYLHQDRYLRKWLIARDWNVKKAVAMFKESHAYRKKMGCDTLLDTYKPPEVVQKFLTGGICGHDKAGSVLRIELFGNLDMKGMMYSVRKQDLEKVKLLECEKVMKLTREKEIELGKNIDGMTVVMNLENMSSRVLWKPGLDMYLYMVKILEDNYPEMLKHLFVINAPSIFPIIWKICRPLISEATKNKIHVLGSNYPEVLLEYIDAEQLPKFMGGKLTDPDGNPRCCNKIGQGGIIPTSFYLTDLTHVDNLESKVVPRSEKLELRYEISAPNSILRWEFKTEEYDIGFGLDFEDKGGQRETIKPVERVNSHMVPEDGSYPCQRIGTYILILDNGFSWARSKEVRYHVEIVNSDDPSLQSELNDLVEGESWDKLAPQLKDCNL